LYCIQCEVNVIRFRWRQRRHGLHFTSRRSRLCKNRIVWDAQCI